jgi:hypothetical protein
VECYLNRKTLILPPELSGSTTLSHLVAKQEELEKEVMNLDDIVYLSYFERLFNMA